MAIPHSKHSSIDGHIGCFCFLAVMNLASLNICIQVFTSTYVLFLSGTYLGVELLDHRTNGI